MFYERDKGGKRAWWREWGQVSQELVHHGMEMWRHSSTWFIPWDTHFLAPGTTLKHTHTHTGSSPWNDDCFVPPLLEAARVIRIITTAWAGAHSAVAIVIFSFHLRMPLSLTWHRLSDEEWK